MRRAQRLHDGIVEEPRLSKKGVQFANIKLSAPEMFQNYPVASRRTVSWKDSKILHYNDTKLFLEASFGYVSWVHVISVIVQDELDRTSGSGDRSV